MPKEHNGPCNPGNPGTTGNTTLGHPEGPAFDSEPAGGLPPCETAMNSHCGTYQCGRLGRRFRHPQ
eukprot:8854307-Lingulodinium_polyedra.AAC.1